MIRALALALLLAACADASLPPAPEPSRNITVGALGLASAIVTCGDGVQKGAKGVGAGFILTDCPGPAPKDRPTQPISRVGIFSVGLGLAATVANCPQFTGVVSFGVGLGAAAFPCP